MDVRKRCSERLRVLSGSQQSVETVSLWLLHHGDGAEQCVEAWKDAVKAAKPGKRLPLFYLANHVVHLAKQKAPTYVKLFGSAAIEAAKLLAKNMTGAEKKGLLRILGIWKERNIFDKEYLKQFETIIKNPPSAGGGGSSKDGSTRSSTAAPKKNYQASAQHVLSILDEMSNAETDDLEEQAAKIPKTYFSEEVLNTVQDKAQGKELLSAMQEATTTLAKYQGSRAAGVEDQYILVRTVKGNAQLLSKHMDAARRLLSECETKQAQLQTVVAAVDKKRSRLPKEVPASTQAQLPKRQQPQAQAQPQQQPPPRPPPQRPPQPPSQAPHPVSAPRPPPPHAPPQRYAPQQPPHPHQYPPQQPQYDQQHPPPQHPAQAAYPYPPQQQYPHPQQPAQHYPHPQHPPQQYSPPPHHRPPPPAPGMGRDRHAHPPPPRPRRFTGGYPR